MTWRRGLAAGVLTVAGVVVVATAPAAAKSCHHFSVSASPGTVSEGNGVTVTVSRDGAGQPSSVRVRTVAGSASNGTDFTPVDRTVAFSGGEVAQTFTLPTTEDIVPEAGEQLRLRVSSGSGCGGTPLSYGPDAVVTIQDDDQATTTTASTTTTSSTTSSTSSTSTTSSTTSSTTTTSGEEFFDEGTVTSESASDTTVAAARSGVRDEGGGSWVLPIVLGVVLVLAFAAALVARRRLAGSEVDEYED